METAVQPEGRAGKLTIFAGYMSGIGTAAAMLRAADRARQSGTDVVAGAAISCECPEARSFEGLWQAENPERLDLDAALRRKPGLLLVENLAYRNQEGRHKKRHPAPGKPAGPCRRDFGKPGFRPDSRPGVRPGRPGRACGHGPQGPAGTARRLGRSSHAHPAQRPAGAGLPPLCGPYFPRHKGGAPTGGVPGW